MGDEIFNGVRETVTIIASLAPGVWGAVNSPHKWSVTRKMFLFDDVIMIYERQVLSPGSAEFRIFITNWARVDRWYRFVKWYPAILTGLCPRYGPLDRYVKLWVAHAPGMPGAFSPPLQVSNPDTHHGTCMTHVPWCMPGSLTSGFLLSRWQWKGSQDSRRMRNHQFYASGKRSILPR